MICIAFKPAFLRTLKKLPLLLQEEVKQRIKEFELNPEKASLKVHKLSGRLKGTWSFSVNYKYRIVLEFIDDHTAVLLDVGDHTVYNR